MVDRIEATSVAVLNKKHGESSKNSITSEYRAWKDLRGRCLTPGNKRYSSYGGRGIFVCERWNNYENFLKDMGRKPEGTSLDRIDNDGPYTPENCRWATAAVQMKNRRKYMCITNYSDEELIKEFKRRGLNA